MTDLPFMLNAAMVAWIADHGISDFYAGKYAFASWLTVQLGVGVQTPHNWLAGRHFPATRERLEALGELIGGDIGAAIKELR